MTCNKIYSKLLNMTILKTPRTDERELKNGGCYGYDFARELEIELTAAQQTIRDLQAERERLRDTLKQYASLSNWGMNSWTDVNSSNFDGMWPAIKALSRAEADSKGTK